MTVKRLKDSAPWLAVVLLFLLPLYIVSFASAARSGLFSLNGRVLSDQQFRALLTFIASGFATIATVLGLLFTRSHNRRTEELTTARHRESEARLILESGVKSLELLVLSDGHYAPRARVAGALATLVHLGHPSIAMRTLRAIWSQDAVDSGTAAWLVSEVYKKRDSEDIKLEAAYLLRDHVRKLPTDIRPQFEWPDALWERWPVDMPRVARYVNLTTVIYLLLEKERSWWGSSYMWALCLLDEARLKDPDPWIKDNAANLLEVLTDTFDDEAATYMWQEGVKTLNEVRKGLTRHSYTSSNSSYLAKQLEPRIRTWARPDTAGM